MIYVILYKKNYYIIKINFKSNGLEKHMRFSVNNNLVSIDKLPFLISSLDH